MYAVIADGGKQYCVEEGQTVLIELRSDEPGQSIEFDRVLAIGGESIQLGQPVIDGAKVVAEVLAHIRLPKVQIQDYKRRKNFRKHKGHRQPMTEIVIRQIVAG